MLPVHSELLARRFLLDFSIAGETIQRNHCLSARKHPRLVLHSFISVDKLVYKI
jgi:hypothetical protein